MRGETGSPDEIGARCLRSTNDIAHEILGRYPNLESLIEEWFAVESEGRANLVDASTKDLRDRLGRIAAAARSDVDLPEPLRAFLLRESVVDIDYHASGRGDRRVSDLGARSQRVTLLPPGFCLRCGHHENGHRPDGSCEYEVRDYGDMDCSCPGLRLCAACEGDPEALDLHVCGRSA